MYKEQLLLKGTQLNICSNGRHENNELAGMHTGDLSTNIHMVNTKRTVHQYEHLNYPLLKKETRENVQQNSVKKYINISRVT